MPSLTPAASLGNSTTQPSTFAAFFRECAVILVISYPILLFLLTVYPGVLPLATLPIFFLFGLTAICTAVVSSVINLVVILTRRYYGYEESAPSDVKILSSSKRRNDWPMPSVSYFGGVLGDSS